MTATAENDRIINLMARCWSTAEDKGWNEDKPQLVEMLMLTVSELSECLEEYRNGHTLSEIYFEPVGEDYKPEGIAVELADAVIRIFHMCYQLEIPLVEAMDVKMNFNDKRPYRHGGKKL